LKTKDTGSDNFTKDIRVFASPQEKLFGSSTMSENDPRSTTPRPGVLALRSSPKKGPSEARENPTYTAHPLLLFFQYPARAVRPMLTFPRCM
jgi:hypothetical protein